MVQNHENEMTKEIGALGLDVAESRELDNKGIGVLGLAAAESRELTNKGIGVLELAAVLAPVSDGSRLRELLDSSLR